MLDPMRDARGVIGSRVCSCHDAQRWAKLCTAVKLAAACALLGIAGCSLDAHHIAVLEAEIVEYGAASQDAAVDGEDWSVTLLLEVDGAIGTLSTTVAEDALSDPGEVTTTQVFDFGKRSLRVVRGEEVEELSFAELDYEDGMRRRRNLVDFLTAFSESEAVRGLEHVDFFVGDERSIVMGWDELDGFVVRHQVIAIEPGVYWELWAATAEPVASRAATEAYLVAVLGVAPVRARRVAQLLGGFPLRVIATVFSAEADELVVDYRLRHLSERLPAGEETVRGSHFSDLERTQAELRRRLKDRSFVRRVLGDLSSLPRGMRPTLFFLELGRALRPSDMPWVQELYEKLEDPYVEIEVVRATLRCCFPASTWRAYVAGASHASKAMSVVEAMAAEGHPETVPVLMSILERRHMFDDFGAEEVVAWATAHLRGSAGLSLEALEQLSKSRTGTREVAASEGAALAWIEWWKTQPGNMVSP